MILTETIFLEGNPVGVIRRDDYSGEIAFSPIKGRSRLPAKDWKSIDELKAAVISAYQNDESPLINSRLSNPLDGITGYRIPITDD